MLPPWRNILPRLLDGCRASEAETRAIFDAMLRGEMPEGDIAAMLGAIAARGPFVDELVGAARSLRACATAVSLPTTSLPVLDTCGTGGAPKLFNVSTLGAIVTAAAAPGRVLVAKHGNRSRTGRGSAELLESLGVNINASPETQAVCLRQLGLCFFYAPAHHPAARHAAAVRKQLGFPTIFNLLGPLVNPAGATCQLVGTYSHDAAALLAGAFARLEVPRVLVVSSRDGLDEITTTAPTDGFEVLRGRIAPFTLDASQLGLTRATINELQVHGLNAATAAATEVLSGRSGPMLDMVVLNAAASLYISGVVPSIRDGLEPARSAIMTGAARSMLDGLIRLSNATGV